MTKNLLAICFEFAPGTTPTAIRSAKLLTMLPPEWQVKVITAENCAPLTEQMEIHMVKNRAPHLLLKWAAKLKLDKFTEALVWPDDKIFWIIPALRRARQLIRQRKPDMILVFMMPYASGLIGLLLKWITGLPVIFNLDDSPTCTDMHPSFPSRLHYKMTRWLEDRYVKTGDASIYVSEFNRAAVQSRQSPATREKIHLIRYGADPSDFSPGSATRQESGFRMVYLGGMNGWHAFHPPLAERHPLKRLYLKWMQWGRVTCVKLDYRSSSPIFVGKAIQQVLVDHPEWHDQIRLEIFGNRYPTSVVNHLLESQQVADVVRVSGPIPNSEAILMASQADLLFLTLPGRCDGSSGGRISAKTYEYLMTDRPILAALPQGENWNYLADKPGVWLVATDDVESMAKTVSYLAEAKFAGYALAFDRSHLHPELSYKARAAQLDALLNQFSSADISSETESLKSQPVLAGVTQDLK